MVQRLKTAREKWFGLIKTAYLFTFPFLVILGVITLLMAFSFTGVDRTETFQFSMLVWIGVLIPLAMFIHGVVSRHRLLKRITRSMKDPQYFWPSAGYEIYHKGDGKYLGIDTNKGTLLYIHRIRKGQVDVLGLTVNDLTELELVGNGLLRLYTKHPELPCIEIGTPWAKLWCDTLGAMEHRQPQTPLPFREYVNDYIDTLEQANRVHIPRFA